MNWKLILLVLLVLALVGVAIYYWRLTKDYGKHIFKLPLRDLGYRNIPAVPFQLTETIGTLARLLLRAYAITQAKWGMSNEYRIGDQTANGYTFQYGRGTNSDTEKMSDLQSLKDDLKKTSLKRELMPDRVKNRLNTFTHPVSAAQSDPLTLLSLTDPEQFTMSWTTFNYVYEKGQQVLPAMIETMTSAASANRSFWPTISQHGFAFNLLILEKVTPEMASDYKEVFGNAWTSAEEQLMNDGKLYAIDLRMFASLPANTVKDAPRFTPATLTLLAQQADKSLLPVSVAVSNPEASSAYVVYQYGVCTDGSWLYALMAAKASITVYGIWIGHVYHWHIVSAALLMTLNNTVEETHPLRIFMAPQSDFVIPFNDALLLLWKQIAPPTSISTAEQFIALMDRFATGRTFLQDNPDEMLAQNGIQASDFSNEKEWDQFPIAGEILSVFHASEAYVRVFVNQTWESDAAVVADKQVQAWVAASSDPANGNVAGIPSPDSRESLITILKSLVFRITVHGASRLNSTANPVFSFVPNYPPCLQRTDLPDPEQELSTTELLKYLPHTGTIGEMVTFLFTFVFSAPYVPFVPVSGSETELIWPGGADEPRNQALIRFRQFIEDFIGSYEGDTETAQIHQWPRNIET